MKTSEEVIKLTAYSHGAGCGCKISPAVLDEMLSVSGKQLPDKNLLVGNNTKDDAAVYSLGNGTAIISTTDFFMPIVDDPVQFGKIASVNAISDVYALGGKPLMAIAILGWPIDKLSPQVAGKVLEGAKAVCKEAGIPLGGGHSIDSPEPIFGLAVTGIVDEANIKRNSGGMPGDLLYLTKPIGVGILSTAMKNGYLKEEHASLAPELMMKLNSIGELLGKHDAVHAMTDVTGFGLMGHLNEMCSGSNVDAIVYREQVPLIDGEILKSYLNQGAIPGGTVRNFKSYGNSVVGMSEEDRNLFCDPQTSGGLLIAVSAERSAEIEGLLNEFGLINKPLGVLTERAKGVIVVQ